MEHSGYFTSQIKVITKTQVHFWQPWSSCHYMVFILLLDWSMVLQNSNYICVFHKYTHIGFAKLISIYIFFRVVLHRLQSYRLIHNGSKYIYFFFVILHMASCCYHQCNDQWFETLRNWSGGNWVVINRCEGELLKTEHLAECSRYMTCYQLNQDDHQGLSGFCQLWLSYHYTKNVIFCFPF